MHRQVANRTTSTVSLTKVNIDTSPRQVSPSISRSTSKQRTMMRNRTDEDSSDDNSCNLSLFEELEECRMGVEHHPIDVASVMSVNVAPPPSRHGIHTSTTTKVRLVSLATQDNRKLTRGVAYEPRIFVRDIGCGTDEVGMTNVDVVCGTDAGVTMGIDVMAGGDMLIPSLNTFGNSVKMVDSSTITEWKGSYTNRLYLYRYNFL